MMFHIFYTPETLSAARRVTLDLGGKRASKTTGVVINDKISRIHSIAFSFSYFLSLSTYLTYSNVSDAFVSRINQFPTTTSAAPNAFLPVSEICSSYDETCPSDVFPTALPILFMGIPLRPRPDRHLHIFQGTTTSFRRWISPFRHSTIEICQTLINSADMLSQPRRQDGLWRAFLSSYRSKRESFIVSPETLYPNPSPRWKQHINSILF